MHGLTFPRPAIIGVFSVLQETRVTWYEQTSKEGSCPGGSHMVKSPHHPSWTSTAAAPSSVHPALGSPYGLTQAGVDNDRDGAVWGGKKLGMDCTSASRGQWCWCGQGCVCPARTCAGGVCHSEGQAFTAGQNTQWPHSSSWSVPVNRFPGPPAAHTGQKATVPLCPCARSLAVPLATAPPASSSRSSLVKHLLISSAC